MRPKKTRTICCSTNERCFKPQCLATSRLKSVQITLDEFEAVRLADLLGLQQVEAAKQMKVSRPTFSRILSSAHAKVADGLVNLKEILIAGGCCVVAPRNRRKI
ncbi:hypothetical protein A2311_01420 [candidate division WOR-1 bacterium RIFOXYB2_FULL_48_7]|uniref:UPF0251 protein A2311_01420 n=1 Tax=candidate division WOR-1 bacterium RIFOXYB2_FULL_48_7 TaxID=1802583 RepID=A0A1F4TUA7_UNCSA|nr:MAG: hypothetical protein A2311_01420 [candidate division WOR-1 bacterium RIFOXYB2_FULL_48_7]